MLLKPSGLYNISSKKSFKIRREDLTKPSVARLPTEKSSIYPPLYFRSLEGKTDITFSLDMHATNLKNSRVRVWHIDDIDDDDDNSNNNNNNSFRIYLCTDLTAYLIITK
jgi:hypothetical protein